MRLRHSGVRREKHGWIKREERKGEREKERENTNGRNSTRIRVNGRKEMRGMEEGEDCVDECFQRVHVFHHVGKRGRKACGPLYVLWNYLNPPLITSSATISFHSFSLFLSLSLLPVLVRARPCSINRWAWTRPWKLAVSFRIIGFASNGTERCWQFARAHAYEWQ